MTEMPPYTETMPSVSLRPSSLHPPIPPSSALEQAQQHLRDIKSEPIKDLDTALQRLEEERRK